MESATVHWVTPLAILPGVALLIMSTANRYLQIHDELQRLRDDGHYRTKEQTEAALSRLLKRSVLFRNALVSLYLAVAALALAAFIGGVSAYLWPEENFLFTGVFSVIGIVCLVYASLHLIREASLSLSLIRRYGKEICHQLHKDDP